MNLNLIKKILKKCILNARFNKNKMIKSPQLQINKTLPPDSQNSNSQLNSSQNLCASSQHQFSPLLLQKKLNQHRENSKYHGKDRIQTLSNDQIQFINSNGIVKRYQLVLITCLIMASIASVKYSEDGYFDHIKTIRDYFDSELLGNDDRRIYEYGDNIDESFLELQMFEDINEHFDNFVQVIKNFTDDDAFTEFKKPTQKNVILSYSFLNQSSFKGQVSIEELESFLFFIDRRQFLLHLDSMDININLGSNKRIDSLNLTVYYDLSSRMLLNVQLELSYTPNLSNIKNSNDQSIRLIQRLLAFMLLCSYLHNAYKIKIENNQLKKLNIFHHDVKTLQKNRSYWCYSLTLLNTITILSETYAPFCSFMQLLPIFQRHDSANVYKYNFNTNIRYAIPLVMRIFIPVFIMLNGFIFYSMLMYPGQYFQDYTMAMFSYVYQNFQVGTYQIFIELQSRGNFAYLLYGILYFYMVLVGSNLIPALFCTMIYIKIYQNDLKSYIQKTVRTAICPKCNQQNFHQQQQRPFQLSITSPKISPYLKGKLSTVSNQSQISLVQKVTKMYIESDKVEHEDFKGFLKAKIEKIKTLTQKLKNTTSSVGNIRQHRYFMMKIEKLSQEIGQLDFLSPIRSPTKHR